MKGILTIIFLNMMLSPAMAAVDDFNTLIEASIEEEASANQNLIGGLPMNQQMQAHQDVRVQLIRQDELETEQIVLSKQQDGKKLSSNK